MKQLASVLRSRALRRGLLGVAGAIALAWLGLFAASFVVAMPKELLEGRPASSSIVFRDRDGAILREARAGDGTRARWIAIDEAGPDVARAIVAAEDRRFYSHHGVDPLAIARAAFDDVIHLHVVSGASTLTQQLARTVAPRGRSLPSKLLEMALALKIERSLSKREILEQYLNRVAFGPGVRGVEAASRFYFDKPARDLSLAEAAALASLPRGPSLYDPKRGTERVHRRRDRVLERMRAAGLASDEETRRALAEPIAIAKTIGVDGAPHLVEAVLEGKLDDGAAARSNDVTLTIDRGLQRELEALARSTVRDLAGKHVTAASIVVLDNETGDVLAWVGSPDAHDEKNLGSNDGVLAARQPGSSLKPFVYELAMEKLGFTAATALPDVELHLPAKDGDDYDPHNYDGRYHGPVRLREALANSFNVPAVRTAAALGPRAIVERLHALGFRGLDDDADDYGAAIALGDAEVRLIDLAGAYATLARGGRFVPFRAVKSDAAPVATRVMSEADAFVVTDILADKNARLASFGAGNVLELPFPCAVKTGTSKGYRDNITAGYTPAVTVAVWVGNFDGAPMEGVSGVTGAGPLFHDAMLAAARRRPSGDFKAPDGAIEAADVCALSGDRPGPRCNHVRHEIFAKHDGRSSAPAATCAMHVEVAIDSRNGLLAGPGCVASEKKTFEAYGPELVAWARGAGRPLAPDAFSPLCPGSSRDVAASKAGRLRVAYPPDGATFAIDASLASKQALPVRAEVPSGTRNVALVIDGEAHAVSAPYAFTWSMKSGEHRAKVVADGRASDEVEFSVE